MNYVHEDIKIFHICQGQVGYFVVQNRSRPNVSPYISIKSDAALTICMEKWQYDNLTEQKRGGAKLFCTILY